MTNAANRGRRRGNMASGDPRDRREGKRGDNIEKLDGARATKVIYGSDLFKEN